MRNGKYMKREVLNLARFISVTKFRPLSWRGAHPYLVADRFEVKTCRACCCVPSAACPAHIFRGSPIVLSAVFAGRVCFVAA